MTSQFSFVSMLSCDRCRYSLRYEIFPFAGHAIVEWPAMHCGKLFSKVTMSRRGRRNPFQSSRVPRIAFSHAPAENAEEEVEQENQLGRSQNKCGDRNEHVHRLLWLKEHVLSRVIDSPHLATDSDDVHRKKHAIGADEGEPEMNLSECRIHEPAEHFGKPEVDARKCSEQGSDRHNEMEMGNDEIRVLKLDIRS